MIKLVIFDLDGTLLNTVEDLGNAANEALKANCFPVHEISEYNFLCGRGIRNMLHDALPENARTDGNIRKLAEIFYPYYDEHKSDCTKPYEGIAGLVERLAGDGVRIAVASNKYQDAAEKLIDSFFGKYGFVKVLGQREGHPVKPDPAIVTEIMKSVPDVKLDEVLYVGDTNVDMQTGINAGVRTVGVTWGFRSREELAAFNPYLIADVPEDIAEAVSRLKHKMPE